MIVVKDSVTFFYFLLHALLETHRQHDVHKPWFRYHWIWTFTWGPGSRDLNLCLSFQSNILYQQALCYTVVRLFLFLKRNSILDLRNLSHESFVDIYISTKCFGFNELAFSNKKHLTAKLLSGSVNLFESTYKTNLTFHWRVREFLVRLVILGGFGISGSQLIVVKLSASEGFPFMQLLSAWTLE